MLHRLWFRLRCWLLHREIERARQKYVNRVVNRARILAAGRLEAVPLVGEPDFEFWEQCQDERARRDGWAA